MRPSKKDIVTKQIKAKAVVLFRKYGIKKVTLSDIASQVGIDVSTLYYYFKNKTDLISQVLTEEIDNFIVVISKKLEKLDDPVIKLKEYFLERMKYLRKTLDIYNITLPLYFELKDLVFQTRKKFFVKEKEILSHIVKQGVEQGVFRKIDIEFFAISILASLRGLDEVMFLEKQIQPGEKSYKKLLDILFNGILIKESY